MSDSSDLMDYSPPGSSVHGISQARILEWAAISFSKGIFLTQGLNQGLLQSRWILYQLNHQGAPYRVYILVLISQFFLPSFPPTNKTKKCAMDKYNLDPICPYPW